MRVRFAGAAEADLKAIYLSGSKMFGRRRAEAYVAGLRRTVQQIADYPLASRLRTTIEPPIRARPFQSHVIIYTVDEAGVLILRFRHGHENWLDDTIEGEDEDQ